MDNQQARDEAATNFSKQFDVPHNEFADECFLTGWDACIEYMNGANAPKNGSDPLVAEDIKTEKY